MKNFSLEFRYLLKQILKPLTGFDAVIAWVKLAITRGARRLPNLYFFKYPKEIRKLCKIASRRKNLPPPPVKPAIYDVFPQKLWIAGHNFIEVDDWRQCFDDIESNISLQRWTWLIRSKQDIDTDTPIDYEKGIRLLTAWVQCFSATPKGIDSESYSVSERISNFCLFYLYHQRQRGSLRIPELLVFALDRMVRYLLPRLEYHPCGMTGNHILNNGRALYLFGVVFQSKLHRGIASRIFNSHLPILFENKGFLREGSTHYQFLVTNWICQIFSAAGSLGDKRCLAITEETAKAAIEACRYFVVYDETIDNIQLPLFGDVSPDIEISWLTPLLSFQIGEKEMSIGGSKYLDKTSSCLALIASLMKPGTGAFLQPGYLFSGDVPDNLKNRTGTGWNKICHGKWTIFLRTDQKSWLTNASHEHHDIGSVIIFYNGKPIIIDLGRYNYSSNGCFSSGGFSPESHNMPVVNGSPAMLIRRDRYFGRRYKKSDLKVFIEPRTDGYQINLEHTGFSRILNSRVTHTRIIDISAISVTLTDKIDGVGRAEVAFNWHFGNKIVNVNNIQPLETNALLQLNKDVSLHISCDNPIKMKSFFGESNEKHRGWCYQNYGQAEPTSSLLIESTNTLPFVARHEFKSSAH